MKIVVYAVRIGKKLYIDSSFYRFYPSSTDNILNAKWFAKLEDAEKMAKVSGGDVIEFTLSDDEDDYEIDALKAAVRQLQVERDAALNELNILKHGHHV